MLSEVGLGYYRDNEIAQVGKTLWPIRDPVCVQTTRKPAQSDRHRVDHKFFISKRNETLKFLT